MSSNQLFPDSTRGSERYFSVVDSSKWLEVKFDRSKGDFFLEVPCSGKLSVIEIAGDIFIDDSWNDYPIEFTILSFKRVDSTSWGLKLRYLWDDGQLKDSITVSPVDDFTGVYEWKRHLVYNEIPQERSPRFFATSQHASNMRRVVLDCLDEKVVEIIRGAEE